MHAEPPAAGLPRRIAGCAPPLGAYDADIVILSFNRGADTIAAVESALGQRGITIHVTVLDQGSDPAGLRKLARHFRQAADLALYAVPENLGVAGGRNLATALGHGQIIIALDNDAVFLTPWVAAQAWRNFAEMPDLGALGFNILDPGGTFPDRASWGYPAKLLPRHREKFFTTTFVGAGHAIRRAAWNAAGGYDPDLFFTWEEYDFCLRAIALGWRIRYDGSLGVIHKSAGEARIGWDGPRLTYYIRNRLIIARKWGASWLSLAPRIAAYLLNGALAGRFPAALAGVKAALAAKPRGGKKMPAAMRAYVFRHETRHRGSWWERWHLEVLSRVKREG